MKVYQLIQKDIEIEDGRAEETIRTISMYASFDAARRKMLALFKRYKSENIDDDDWDWDTEETNNMCYAIYGEGYGIELDIIPHTVRGAK